MQYVNVGLYLQNMKLESTTFVWLVIIFTFQFDTTSFIASPLSEKYGLIIFQNL